MDSSASDFLLNSSALQSVYFQGRSESNGLLDLGLSLRTQQPEASYHPSDHGLLPPSVESLGFSDLLSWTDGDSETKNLNSGLQYSMLGPEDCDEESEGVQSKERWSYIKVNMDGAMVGRKVCLLDHGSYLNLAHQLEDMFGNQTVSGLRLFETGSAFCLLYKDREERWRTVGDVPWKEFVESVKRLRIAQKHGSSYPCSSTFM